MAPVIPAKGSLMPMTSAALEALEGSWLFAGGAAGVAMPGRLAGSASERLMVLDPQISLLSKSSPLG